MKSGRKGRFGKLLNRDSSTLAFQVFSLSRYAALLFTSVLLARMFPDQILIGNYERLILLGGSITFFWVSGLFDAFLVLFRKSEANKQNRFSFSTFWVAVVFALLTSLLTAALGSFVFVDGFAPEELYGYAAFIGLDTLAMFLVYLWVAKKKGKQLILYAFLSSLVYATTFLLHDLKLGMGAAWFTLATIAGLKVVVLVFSLPWQKGSGPDRKSLKRLFLVGGPLAATALLSYSATYLDSYLVERFFTDQFSNFRYGAKELPLILLLANSLSLVHSGNLAEVMGSRNPDSGLRKLKTGANRLIYFLFPLSLILLFCSNWLFEFVFGTAFNGAVPIFDVYLLLIIPRLIFPQSILRAHEKTHWMTISAFVELILNVSLSLLGMYYYGIVGIAAATVVAYSADKLLLIVFVKQKLNLSARAYIDFRSWGAFSILLIAAFIAKYLLWS